MSAAASINRQSAELIIRDHEGDAVAFVGGAPTFGVMRAARFEPRENLTLGQALQAALEMLAARAAGEADAIISTAAFLRLLRHAGEALEGGAR